MVQGTFRDLKDCTVFRQTLEARTPRGLRWLLFVMLALLGSAFAWASVAKVDLIVKAKGRVRPIT